MLAEKFVHEPANLLHFLAHLGEPAGRSLQKACLGVAFQLPERRNDGRHPAREAGAGQFVGKMIDLPDIARRNGLAQARHDFGGLAEVEVHEVTQ